MNTTHALDRSHLATMRHPHAACRWPARGVAMAALAVVAGSLTGCQVDVGGQTLPSAYYLQDDIQYFPAGPEFKLSKEAAALKAYKDEHAKDEPCNGCGQCSNCR